MNAKQKKQCIDCPIGHRIISAYYDFLPEYLRLISIKNNKNYENELLKRVSNSANTISDTLGFKGTLSQKCQMIFNMSDKVMDINSYPAETREHCDCIQRLNHIIASIKTILQDEQSVDLLYEFPKSGVDTIWYIFRYLESNNQELENTLTVKERNWSKEYATNLTDEQADEALEKFQEIVRTYCEEGVFFNFHYCNPIYSLKGKYQSCVENTITPSTPNAFLKFQNMVPYIEEKYLHILYAYLKKAPKHFGYNLNAIMEYQGMTDTDIVNLMSDTSKKPNNIQSYRKSPTNELTPKEVKELSRILLVSEETLICGIGGIYGSWKIALKSNKNSEFRKAFYDIPKYAEKKNTEQNGDEEGVKDKKAKTPMLNPSSTKKEIISFIKKVIQEDDKEFFEDISTYPDFFNKEDFCAYFYEEDGELFYDYQAMYDQLLEPKSFDVLLSVLLELQETHETEDNEPDSISPQEWLDIVSKQNN